MTDDEEESAVFTVELGVPPTAMVALSSDAGATEAGFALVEAARARRRTLSAIGVVGGGARFRARQDGPNLVGGELGYRDELCFASELVRNALLVRRILRDARLGRNEMRERLRLPPPAEALLRRELDADTVRRRVR